MLSNQSKVVASIAPSFASVFNLWQADRLPSALRQLGFSAVSNTSEGAYLVAKEFLRLGPDSGQNIVSACPATVNYIEKFKRAMIPKLVPLVSPMIAHGKLIKQIYGQDTRVVFIGPCICKKYEASRKEYRGIIDAVLTFQELFRWLEQSGVDLAQCEESGFDSQLDFGSAGLFPLPGGFMKTAEIGEESLSYGFIETSGDVRVLELLEMKEDYPGYIDPLYCREGCINGPGIGIEKNIYQRRNDLFKYYSRIQKAKKVPELPVLDLKTQFDETKQVVEAQVTEAQILEVFTITGKEDLSHQLNCGSCGYRSCREKAIAVVNGMAEAQMCVPYMRRQADQRMDMIRETIPVGRVILDKNLHIIGMNPAFRRFFLSSNATFDKRISYLFESKGFEKLLSGTLDKLESVVNFEGSLYHQYLYSLPEQKQYIGIYSDIKHMEIDEGRISDLKQKVIEKVVELRDQQVNMAHEFAMLLGENTGRVEEILWRLENVYEED
jgi:PAS domain-containing protein